MGERTKLRQEKPGARVNHKTIGLNETKSQSNQSPVDRILNLQKTIGNKAVTRLIQTGAIQAKFQIGQPNDIYEQEADRVAEQVMRMPEPGCSEYMEVDEEQIQNKQADNQIPVTTSNIDPGINSLRGEGQTLPLSIRTFALGGGTGTIDPDTGIETITKECCPLQENVPWCHPDKFTVHDRGSIVNGGTRALYRFEYTGKTDNTSPCSCECCAFVQYVRGFFELNGRRVPHTLPGSGSPLSPTALGQDSPVIPHVKCAVARVGGAPLSDTPGFRNIKSTDNVNVHLVFDARTIDTCKSNKTVASRVFTLKITGSHPRRFSVSGDVE